MADPNTVSALWWAVIISGLYHGLNPGMGWPLAVSAALMERRVTGLFRAMLALAGGHALAMVALLLPFSALLTLAAWDREIRLAAAVIVIAAGLWLLINRKHPRFLARVPPGRLALWSFLAAMAHGAGLMLVPIYLGLCDLAQESTGHAAASALMGTTAGAAILVSLAHTLAMTAGGGAVAYGVYRWLGLGILNKGWFNLDVFWALSLVLVGVVSLIMLG